MVPYDATLQGGPSSGSLHEGTLPPESHILTVPYSAEYLNFRPDTALLDDIARITGGTRTSAAVVSGGKLFANSGESVGEFLSIWRLMLMVGLVLFLVDIALRQVLRGRKGDTQEESDGMLMRIRRTTEARSAKRPTYDELLEHLRTGQRRESDHRDFAYWFCTQRKQADTTLRLYLAKKRKG